MSEKLRLMGTRRNKLDAKGRLAVPAKWREMLGETVVVTIGLEHCLDVYREEDFYDLMSKLEDTPFLSDEKIRQYRRNMFSDGEVLDLDKQGRILLTPEHRKYATMEEEMDVIVKGVGDHLEIWNESVWEAYNEGFSMEETAKALAGHGF